MSQIISTAETVWRIPQICRSNRNISKLSFLSWGCFALFRLFEDEDQSEGRDSEGEVQGRPQVFPSYAATAALPASGPVTATLTGGYLPGSDVSAQISSGCPIFTVFMTLSLKMSMTSENWSKIAGVSLIRPTTCRKNIVDLLTAHG